MSKICGHCSMDIGGLCLNPKMTLKSKDGAVNRVKFDDPVCDDFVELPKCSDCEKREEAGDGT